MPSKQVPMTFWVDMTAPIPDLLRSLCDPRVAGGLRLPRWSSGETTRTDARLARVDGLDGLARNIVAEEVRAGHDGLG
jgi:hypothetical protein